MRGVKMNFSVLMSIYYKEKSEYFDKCMQSVWDEQSLKPNEIVLVEDGKLTDELYQEIEKWKYILGDMLKILPLEKNVGLGIALNKGLEACSHEWVARMDCDDIALPERFEKQITFLEKYPNIDVIGSWVAEFSEDPDKPYSYRKPPAEHTKILSYAKYRNPINHMTVIFRKSAVHNAGDYMPMNGFEDYYLWVRMMQQNRVFANIPEVLVDARAGKDMISRRHGLEYISNEWAFAKAAWKINFLTTSDFMKSVVLRISPRLLPQALLEKAYNLVRKI